MSKFKIGDKVKCVSVETADRMASKSRIVCVKLTGEAEVPEDYND